MTTSIFTRSNARANTSTGGASTIGFRSNTRESDSPTAVAPSPPPVAKPASANTMTVEINGTKALHTMRFKLL